jgi:hypothetical protein
MPARTKPRAAAFSAGRNRVWAWRSNMVVKHGCGFLRRRASGSVTGFKAMALTDCTDFNKKMDRHGPGVPTGFFGSRQIGRLHNSGLLLIFGFIW